MCVCACVGGLGCVQEVAMAGGVQLTSNQLSVPAVDLSIVGVSC